MSGQERILVKRHIRPELFVFNGGVSTLMDIEGCMASMDSPAHYTFVRCFSSPRMQKRND